MPLTKSAKKAMRGSIRRRVMNLASIDKYKDAIKSVRRAAAATQKEAAAKALPAAYAQIDKAVKKHVIHKNKGARLKSRLAALVAKLA